MLDSRTLVGSGPEQLVWEEMARQPEQIARMILAHCRPLIGIVRECEFYEFTQVKIHEFLRILNRQWQRIVFLD